MSAIRSRAQLFVPLLVLALLICHGALGSMDKLNLNPVPTVAVHQLLGEAGTPVPADERPAEHPPAHGYYVVVLLTVFFGALLGLIFRGAVPTERLALALSRSRHDLVLPVFYSQPRAIPAFSQVFRL
ncbi:hypothetical protein BH23ACT11_BH23ACT11_29890 [soil metagenome]